MKLYKLMYGAHVRQWLALDRASTLSTNLTLYPDQFGRLLLPTVPLLDGLTSDRFDKLLF